jgi:hypothetical protein
VRQGQADRRLARDPRQNSTSTQIGYRVFRLRPPELVRRPSSPPPPPPPPPPPRAAPRPQTRIALSVGFYVVGCFSTPLRRARRRAHSREAGAGTRGGWAGRGTSLHAPPGSCLPTTTIVAPRHSTSSRSAEEEQNPGTRTAPAPVRRDGSDELDDRIGRGTRARPLAGRPEYEECSRSTVLGPG